MSSQSFQLLLGIAETRGWVGWGGGGGGRNSICCPVGFANFSVSVCLSGMLFNLIVSYVSPQAIQSHCFLVVFYVLSRAGSGSPGWGDAETILNTGIKYRTPLANIRVGLNKFL